RAKRLIPLCMFCIFSAGVLINVLKPVFMPLMGLRGQAYEIGSYIILVFTIVAVIRMGNWTMNDTYRASGDAVTGTVLEIVFMYLMVIPCVCLAGLKFKVPIRILFPIVYCDEPIRWVIMQIHMYSGKWIRPVTALGLEKLEDFKASRASAKARRQG
ncbi:MAG: hypothetical protein HUK23_05475, partial [Sphaerochaetaceae bacterium]|nr:hypothetical protein [Sphaerochaetaceae bacterium]